MTESNPFTKPKAWSGLILGVILFGVGVSGALELVFQFIPVSQVLAYPVWVAWIGIVMVLLWGSALIFDFAEFWRKQR